MSTAAKSTTVAAVFVVLSAFSLLCTAVVVGGVAFVVAVASAIVCFMGSNRRLTVLFAFVIVVELLCVAATFSLTFELFAIAVVVVIVVAPTTLAALSMKFCC